MLDPAHYVTDNPSLRFSYNEGLWRAIERVQEKIGRVVLRQAHPVNVYNVLNVSWSE